MTELEVKEKITEGEWHYILSSCLRNSSTLLKLARAKLEDKLVTNSRVLEILSEQIDCVDALIQELKEEVDKNDF